MHINAIKDALTTGVFVAGVNKTKQIDEERKKPLICNSLIGTGLSIVSGYIIDSVTNKPAEKFIEKLKNANYGDSNLNKYINGFKIAKPVLILGIMYYAIIPMISTFFGERIGQKQKPV